ncbi:MAG: putative deoxyguanosinetriphosphate triphosphohydrolase [Clostridiales bacterium]|jgi:dGTPase|nr:putative deoxyguanosinetriphosphate triphosphohydrolase [Clostridiales bacterium]
MKIKQMQEEFEKIRLSEYAKLSMDTRGRKIEEPPCDMRTEFQRDRDRVLHCKAFRRLKHKTQVFLSPEGDHYRTRLTHTLEVSQIARTIARALRLNEDLVEAAALGHDLGHTPFGHAGESVLNEMCSFGFKHYEQSVRVVEKLENKGTGLNLTLETIDGIRNHTTSSMPSTLEGKIVRLSDKIAYINHDIDDALRGKILCEEDIPTEYTDILGATTRIRLNTLVHDIVRNSYEQPDIIMSKDVEAAMAGLRKFMFKNVYANSKAKDQEQKAQNVLRNLFDVYVKEPGKMPEEYSEMIKNGEESERVICDYIAGMTDRYAISKFEEYFIPRAWKI